MRGERIERLARPRSPGGYVKLKTTAEHLVSLLAAHGVEYLFLNPGTDMAPVQEAVYALEEAGLSARHLQWWLRFLDELARGHEQFGGAPMTLGSASVALGNSRTFVTPISCRLVRTSERMVSWSSTTATFNFAAAGI